MSTTLGIAPAVERGTRIGSLEGAPAPYGTPAARPSAAEAEIWCKHLAATHYENFHVATFFLPEVLRPHFYSVYGFCRTSPSMHRWKRSRSTPGIRQTRWGGWCCW